MERLVDISKQDDDISLRPIYLDDFTGQKPIKKKLKIYIKAAKNRLEPLDHCLFYGPPGLGKTTLAGIIAREMGGDLRTTTGPALEKTGDLAALLSNLQDKDVLFIDEIHRMNSSIEEVLYSAMEDFELHIMVGKGPLARNICLSLPKFTLVGATTRLGLLTSPLRDRFGIVEQLALYEKEELASIVIRGCSVLKVEIDGDAPLRIADRSRGTPRIALRILKRVRDVAEVSGDGVITEKLAEEAMDMLGLDELGLDDGDRKILEGLVDLFGGGPVGLSTIAAALNEEPQTVEDIYEPYLLQLGLLERTPRGRKATARTYAYLGRKPVEDDQISIPGEEQW